MLVYPFKKRLFERGYSSIESIPLLSSIFIDEIHLRKSFNKKRIKKSNNTTTRAYHQNLKVNVELKMMYSSLMSVSLLHSFIQTAYTNKGNKLHKLPSQSIETLNHIICSSQKRQAKDTTVKLSTAWVRFASSLFRDETLFNNKR